MTLSVAGLVIPSVLSGFVRADGLQDNIPDNVRAVPPVGIEVSAEDRKELEDGLAKLDGIIGSLRERRDTRTPKLLPDVEIFARAVRHGLQYRELFSPRDVKNAKQVLQEGIRRAKALVNGQAPWLSAKGLVVRGYRSKIDQTVQPYGLIVPESYSFAGKSQYRLDLWFHGRGERTSESAFISQRMTQVGRISPRDTIVLHPYGRYSNAFKFAGEIDVLEALEHARQNYRVDDDRVAVRGFSMGGAGCWQMAVHYPDMFFAANPGAGFSETPEFLKFFQKETLNPTWYEKKLWQMYDCTGYGVNLLQLPTVAYSGELDIQKQAADIMEEALARDGIRLTHLIGPQTKHSIHPDSLMEIERRLASLAERGRQKTPREIHFVTYSLRYPGTNWLTLTGLGEHWKQASVDAYLLPNRFKLKENMIGIKTKNTTGMRLSFPAGTTPFPQQQTIHFRIDGSHMELPSPESDGSWSVEIHRDGDDWKTGAAESVGLTKRHGLQGPIDDAFMDSFVIVRPTGKARHEAVEKWTQSELAHTVQEWRRQFRGDAVVKDDAAVNERDIANSNLVLFGDPQSNSVLQKIVDQLPLQWTEDALEIGSQSFNASQHAPILIYPNPLNPKKYVVLNSGFTYREFAYLNNARQVPKLPDWSVVDLRTPPDSLWPGKIVAADFFDEAWKVKRERTRE